MFYLTLIAEKTNYEAQSILFRVEVTQRKTQLKLYINGTHQSLTGVIIEADPFTPGDIYNITLEYIDIDQEPPVLIPDATVNLTGPGFSDNLEPNIHNNYSVLLNSEDLNWGVNYLSILAQKTNYEPQTITIKFEVIAKNSDISITSAYNELINITAYYRDANKKNIASANLSIEGGGYSDQLNAINQRYTKVINSAVFGVGVFYLTLIAEKTNYESQSILFRVEITHRETLLKLYLNGAEKTSKPSIDIPYGKRITIEIEYLDKDLDAFITGTEVNITGEDIDEILDEDPTSEVYSIGIKSETLDIGTRFLSIIATKGNYESQTIRITINVKRIQTEIALINQNTTVTIEPGENINLTIELKDLDFGGRIKGATVNYTWERGQGTLEDPDGDGIYQALITNTNVPDGVYTITITVYGADEYDFERFKITLNVQSPEENVLLFQIYLGLAIGGVVGLSSYLVAYQKVLKYPKPIRKLRKFRKMLKKKQMPDLEIKTRETLLKEEYEKQLGVLAKILRPKLKGVKVKATEEEKSALEQSMGQGELKDTDVFIDDSQNPDEL